MDRQAIARTQRRRQALEALQFEQARGDALREQLEAIVAELEGSAIDASAFAQMDPADVEVVRASFQSSEPDVYDEDELIALGLDLSESEAGVDLEEEVARLEDELTSSNRRQQAFARYLDALGS